MARYDILEAGFSSLDETINFGTRAVGDNTNLYEIVTIAVIRSSEITKESDPVKIISEYQQEKIFFSVDKTLRILRDKDITDEIGCFDFDHIIDTFCISTCGKFIVICTANGTITIETLLTGPPKENNLEESNDYSTIFEEKLDDSSVGGYFKGSFFHNSSFYIVTSNGIVKRISIDTDDGDNYLFQSKVIHDLKANINVCAFVYPYLCLDGNKIFVLNLSNGRCQTDNALCLKGLQAIQFHFFGYDNVGLMYRIYPEELLVFNVNDMFSGLSYYFEDVLLVDDGDKESKLHILGVTKDLPPQNKKEIQLTTYPGSDVIYSIPLEGPTHVINIKDPSEDVICFTEIRKNNCLSEIRLQIIVKADPEFRLSKLLQKQLFEEAELFAKTFNISPEVIAQAKARNIMNKVICTTKDIDQLLEILDTIDDPLFKLNCCDTVDCAVGADTRRVFCYGAFMDIAVRDCSKNKDNVLLVQKMNFNDKVHRYDTFMQIYEKYDPTTWKYFVECELISEMKVFLRKREIEKASVIFSRMDRNTVSELTSMDIEEIALMLNKDFQTMRKFLNTFIPISLKYVPDSFVIFVKLLNDRVLQFEQQDSDFPECAIKFVKEMINIMDLTTSVKKHLHMEDWQDLAHLLKALEDLKILSNQFNIRFPLSEYLINPFSIIRTLLSANNDTANFETFIKDFVCPFILKNNLDMDLVLIEEIENLLVYEEEYWISMVPILLKFVTSVDKKLDIAYKILEVTDIPWSNNVKDIARVTCELAPNNPIAESIVDHISKEEILLIMRKYNIHKTEFEKFGDKMFYFNRMIFLDRESVIEDIHHLCIEDNVRQEADLLIIHNLIIKQNFEKAMNILDANSPKQIIALGKRILDRCFYFASAYDLPGTSREYRDYYCIVLNLVWNRLKKHAESLHDKRHFEFDYKIAYAIYGLSEHFKLPTNSNDLIRKKDSLLDTLVKHTTDLYLRDDTFNFETFMVRCKQLAKFFDIDLETLLMKFLANGKNFNPFLRLGQDLLDTSVCSKLLACWAIYLLKYLKGNFVDDLDESLFDVFSNVSKNHEDYIVGIQLAKKLSIKAMINATSEDHLAVMEVIRWIDSYFYLTNISKPLNMDTLQIYHSNNAISKGVQSIEAIKSAFNIYCAILGPLQKNPSLKYLTCFTTNVLLSQDQLHKELERLTWNINILLKEGQYLTCFNVIKTLQEGFLCNPNTPKDTIMMLQAKIKNIWIPKALEAVLSFKYIDKTLLLNLMLLSDISNKSLWHYLNIYKRQPQKLSDITQVALEMCKYHKNTQGQLELTNNLNLCKWWNRIKDKNINYEFFFSASSEDRLKALVFGKQVDLNNFPEYCSDFSLDLQKTYLRYLEITLKCWKPEYKKITDVNGHTNIVMQNDETMLEKECQSIIKNINNTDNVLLLVDRMWPVINFYYYEVFIVLLSIRSKLSTTKSFMFDEYQSLLLFLKNYKRISSPTHSESEKWFGFFPMEAFLDPLSEFRLPLTETFFSSDIWTIIKPEVNLETYTNWFELIPVLQQFLNVNDICTYAIKSAMPSRSNGNVSYSWEWDLFPKYDHVIAKVEECAQYITDLERATAAVYNLMCNMSPGTDQVKVAKLSYMYAQKYQASSSSEDVTKVYIKVKHRYYNYSTICILHKYQLAEKEYLKLVSEPTDLISKLYDDPRIPKHVSSVNFDCPDINSAVDDICALFELTAKKIKFSELMKFLKSDSTLDLNKGAEDHCLLRAYYICESANFHKRLLKTGMNQDDTENMSVRANALKCFYYTSTVDSLETMSTMTHKEFLTYMKKVSLVAKLEDLGLKLTVEELDQYNKKKLSKKLAQVDKPLTIKCIASICKIYELDDLTYWQFIVNSAIRFNMINDLCEYVEYLRFRCVTDFIKDAWNAIIADAFKTDTNYIEALRLLQTCPVIYALNIENFIEKCLFHKRPEIAVILIQYVSNEKHEPHIKGMLLRKTIFEDVARLKDEGILGTDKVLKILESYKYVINT